MILLSINDIKRINKNAKHQQDHIQIARGGVARCLVAGYHGNASCYTKTAIEVNMLDKKYYLSEKMKAYISKNGGGNYRNHDCKINKLIARPLTTDNNKRAGTTNYISRDVGKEFNLNEENVKNLAIRKLTEKEAWRLMAFPDESFEKAKNAVVSVSKNGKIKKMSSSQLYKQAGNSIVVACLEKILKNLLGV